MPKYRRPLNDKQLWILKKIYKFRFANTELIVKSGRSYDRDVMRRRLKILLDQEYIARRYDKTDRQMNKPASYCLAPKGIRALTGRDGIIPTVLHAAYRDRTASQQFIAHNFHIFRLYHKFNEIYPNRFNIFTKSETSGYDYFPSQLPDIYLQAKPGGNDYFLDMIESDFRPVGLRRKLAGYGSHSDEGVWEETTGNEYPKLLLVCPTSAIARSLQRRVAYWLNYEDITVYMTSFNDLINAKPDKARIWTNIGEPEELVDIV